DALPILQGIQRFAGPGFLVKRYSGYNDDGRNHEQRVGYFAAEKVDDNGCQQEDDHRVGYDVTKDIKPGMAGFAELIASVSCARFQYLAMGESLYAEG